MEITKEELVRLPYKMQLAAIKEDGMLLRHIKKQTEELCIAAVKQNVYALQFVKKQTLKICILAIFYNGIFCKGYEVTNMIKI